MLHRPFLSFKFIFLSGLFLFLGINIQAQSARKVAREFTRGLLKNKETILITEPETIYKYNLKKDVLDSLGYLDQEEKDSILWVSSDFIKKINDSVYLSRFIKGYSEELKKYGLIPFIGKMPGKMKSPDYMAKIVQVELEEQYYPYTDSAYVGNEAFVFKKKTNALDVNTWFEIYPVKNSNISGKHKVLFTENLLTDEVDGHFYMNPNGSLRYLYRIDSLSIKKIYKYVKSLGRTYAGYTFDRLLNEYLQKVRPASKENNKFWHYDPYSGRFYIGDEGRFVEVDQK